MQTLLKTTLIALTGTALIAGVAHAQVEQTTTTKTTETYTTATPPQPMPMGQAMGQPMPSHPRIAEVDDRIDAISARISKLHHNDRIDDHQERDLRDRITKVQEEEQKFVSDDGGHLNPREQKILNDHLNRIEQDLKRWKD